LQQISPRYNFLGCHFRNRSEAEFTNQLPLSRPPEKCPPTRELRFKLRPRPVLTIPLEDLSRILREQML
jgi:hypothetical protein